MDKTTQILTLIGNDITSSKLVNSLNAIGLSADQYSIDISDVIFDLMGIEEDKRTDDLYNRYFSLINNGNENKSFIYNYLITYSKI